MSSLAEIRSTTWTRRRFFSCVAACAAVSVLLRLRFVFTPLTVDEGGFVAIGRAWAHGKVLYDDVWVDRPQGLLALFRAWDFIAFGNAQSVRIMAILFGVVAVFGCAIIARSITSPRAGVLAALFVAVMSSAPTLEGFIANGELLSGALSVAGLAVGCLVLFRGWATRWLIVSGVLAGIATSIKQSGYDGLLTLSAFLVLAAIFRWRPRRQAATELGLLVGGFALVWLLLAVHGAFIGWSNWLYAVAGYRLEGRSALSGADWPRFRVTARIAAPILLPALIAAAACGVGSLVARRRRAFEPRWLVLPLWLLIGIVAFATGGQFHHHYWITLTFPVAVTTAVMIAFVERPMLRNGVIVLVLIPALWAAARIINLSRDEVPLEINGDARLTKGEHIADWFHANRSPGDTLYAMCASASWYAVADEDPPYPYLWFDNVIKARGAQRQLRQMFQDPGSQPTFVALFQSPEICDPSGSVAAAIAAAYERVTVIDGIEVVRRIGSS